MKLKLRSSRLRLLILLTSNTTISALIFWKCQWGSTFVEIVSIITERLLEFKFRAPSVWTTIDYHQPCECSSTKTPLVETQYRLNVKCRQLQNLSGSVKVKPEGVSISMDASINTVLYISDTFFYRPTLGKTYRYAITRMVRIKPGTSATKSDCFP